MAIICLPIIFGGSKRGFGRFFKGFKREAEVEEGAVIRFGFDRLKGLRSPICVEDNFPLIFLEENAKNNNDKDKH